VGLLGHLRDDDEYTPEQNAAMIAVLRKYMPKPTRESIIKDAHIHPELKNVDTETVRAEKKRLTELYWEKQREWMKVANERAMYSTELHGRKELRDHGITLAEAWKEREQQG
jgi:hypothetical protein